VQNYPQSYPQLLKIDIQLETGSEYPYSMQKNAGTGYRQKVRESYILQTAFLSKKQERNSVKPI
jgi:hypothetical protein